MDLLQSSVRGVRYNVPPGHAACGNVCTSMTSVQNAANDSIADEILTTIPLLEAIAMDRTLLDRLSPEDRARVHQAVARIYEPDPALRRLRIKAALRERSAIQTAREEALLHATGIRELRRRPVFTTPNVFPPDGFVQEDFDPRVRRRRRAGRDQCRHQRSHGGCGKELAAAERRHRVGTVSQEQAIVTAQSTHVLGRDARPDRAHCPRHSFAGSIHAA